MAIQYQDQKEVVRLYLMGSTKTALAKKFKTTSAAITKTLENPELRLEIEKRYLATERAKENRVITEIKGDIYEYIKASIKDAADKEGGIAFIREVTSVVDTLDKISRLNSGEVTERKEQKNINFDVSEMAKQLKTPEEKLAYLQDQIKL